MTALWANTRLGEVLSLALNPVAVEASKTYPMSGVYSFGRGLFAREDLPGTQTTYRVLHRLGADALVLSQLKAWEGALGVVPPEHEGRFLSPQFATFHAHPDRLDVRFLGWWCRQPSVWEELRRRSRGMGARRDSVSPERFLSLDISLPPLAEQRRIVARVEEFAAKTGETGRLRESARTETDMLGGAAAASLLCTLGPQPKKRLSDLVSIRGGGTPDKSNPLFWSGSIPWISPKDMKSRRLRDGADHISEDATRVSPAKLLPIGSVLVVVRGMILVHTVPVALLEAPATINQDIKALIPRPEIAGAYLTAVLWALNRQLLQLVEKSTHDTRKLQTDALLQFEIPVPPLRDQHRIVAYLDELQAKVDALKTLQEKTAAELDALLPSILDKAFRGEL